MMIEGRGESAPNPWRYDLTRHDLLLALQSASRISGFRRYQVSPSRWKRGLTGTIDIPGVASAVRSDVAPRVVGNAGEIAAAVYLDCNFDDSLLQDGDDGADLKKNKARIQVKTRKSSSSHAKQRLNLVRMKSRGRCTAPTVPIVVFAEVDTDSWRVSLLGWTRSAHLHRYPLVPARQGDHLNVEVPDQRLEPMSSLKDLISCH